MLAPNLSHVNSVHLSGVLRELSSPRYTPSGLPVVEGVVCHFSHRAGGNVPMRVDVEVRFVSVGSDSTRLVSSFIGRTIFLEGFWGPHGIYRLPVLHVNSFCFFCDRESGDL
ncbi:MULTISPECIES: hypothetical protein [Candidatus Ichthyocystis]|uniref:Uncharacterized protein n=1 Tax=Candidatus Ichthyocystis hellenicum TaxID=1561003 RepID=A0A0S4M5A5_9BURK|nr:MULTISPECIES: hypothetical protein [Ichthyocystis]CUT17898.1 hypothetical protein Ark11_1085 [Candidatus Ichthyocystis hellenicum]